MSLSSVRTFRWVMSGLALGAGVLLVATGHTVVGAVIGGLALVRLVFLCSIEARRRRVRASAPSGAGHDPVLRSLVRGQFEVAAGAIGASPSEVRIEFANGHSIAEVAATRGVPVDSRRRRGGRRRLGQARPGGRGRAARRPASPPTGSSPGSRSGRRAW